MAEQEFEGQAVVLALDNPATSAAVAQALIGCAFYLDDPDALFDITATAGPRGPFTMATPKGVQPLTLAKLARGYVVETRAPFRLAALIDTATPAHLKAADEARRVLSRRGISHRNLSGDDAVQLAEALETSGEACPPFATRKLIADLLRRYDLYRPYIALATPWLDHPPVGEAYPIDVVIQLVSACRAIREFHAAMQWTDFVMLPDAAKRVSPFHLAVLFTQRAATHLDLYERDRDATRLKSARKCAARSWAIQQSDECSKVYERLKWIEEALQDERSAAERISQDKRLDDLHKPGAWHAPSPGEEP
jgi:hypothetical protein